MFVLILLLSLSSLAGQKILDGVYKYDISWENVKAAEVTLVLVNDSGYKMRVNGSTSSWLRPFYTLNYEANATIDTQLSDVLAKAFKIDSKEEEQILYRKTGGELFVERFVVKKSSNKHGLNRKHEDKKQLEDVWDPFSAAIAAVSQTWRKGKEVTYDVTNGKTSYKVKLLCVDEVKEPGKTTFYIKPTIESSNKKQIKKFRGATLKLVSRDGAYLIEEIKSKVFIGNVYFRLKSFQGMVPIWFRDEINEAMAQVRNLG